MQLPLPLDALRLFSALPDAGAHPNVHLCMNEAVFLIVLGAFAVLYAAGWLVVGLPKGKRREVLNRAPLGIRHAVVRMAGVAPSRRPKPTSDARPGG